MADHPVIHQEWCPTRQNSELLCICGMSAAFPKAATRPEQDTLNMTELLSGDINRLRYVRRYGTSLVQHPQNTAEHSYYVMLYSYYVAIWVHAETLLVVDINKLMHRALFHDVDECRSGDINRPFKYSDTKLLAALKKAAKEQLTKVLLLIFKETPINALIVQQWELAKDSSLEGAIIEFCDYLEVVSYLWQESKAMSQSMAAHFDTMQDHIRNFKSPRFDFIRPLVNEVEQIVQDMQ